MSDYKNQNLKFINLGLNIALPPDLIGPGKYTRLTNIRTLQEGALTTRFGMDYLANAGEPVRFISRINSDKHLLVLDSGAVKILSASGISDVLAYDDITGVGKPRNPPQYPRFPLFVDPLWFSAVKFTSKISGKDWIYVGSLSSTAGRSGMWKIDENGFAWKWGIRPPLVYNAATADLFDASPLNSPPQEVACPPDAEGDVDCGLDNTSQLSEPYVWVYTYYSSRTDTESNPCDEMTKAIDGFNSGGENNTVTLPVADRKALKLTGFLFPGDPQVDRYRIYRKGGGLADYVLEDEIPVIDKNGNAVDYYISYKYDEAIAGNQLLNANNAVPFTSMEPAFKEADAYGTIAYDPEDPFYDNSVSAPKAIYEQALPVLWGPFAGSYIFGTGDPNRPGIVYWTTAGSPDTAGFTNEVQVSPSAKPLIAGFCYGGNSFVFTKDDLYALDWGGPTAPVEFTPRSVPIGMGLSSPKGYCVASVGVFFVWKDGIYVTDGTTGTKCITKESLKPIFLGKSSSEFLPINWELSDDIVLEAVGQEIHFLYYDIDGERMHLVYDILQDRWQRFLVPSENSIAMQGLYESTLNGLRAYWDFNETDGPWKVKAGDLTCDLARTGSVKVVDGRSVSAITNTIATGQHYASGTFSSPVTLNAGFTVATWFKLDPPYSSGLSSIFWFGATGNAQYIAAFQYYSAHFLECGMLWAPGKYAYLPLPRLGPWADGSWHLLMLRWDPTTKIFSGFVDDYSLWDAKVSVFPETAAAFASPAGGLQTANTVQPSPSIVLSSANVFKVLGASSNGLGQSVDSLMLWDRALTESERLQLFTPIPDDLAVTPSAVQTVYGDENQSQFRMMTALSDGRILVLNQDASNDGETIEVPCRVRTASVDLDQSHTHKEWGVILIDADTGGRSIVVTPWYDNETVQGDSFILSTDSRMVKTFDLGDVYYKNIALDFQWTGPVTVYQATLQYRMDEEATVHWEHPYDSFGMKGWKHLRDGYFALRATADVTLTLEIDSTQTFTYTIPSTGGDLKASYVKFNPTKGKMYRFSLDSAEPFRLYLDDTYVNVKLWQTGNTYQSLHLGGEGVNSLEA